MKYIPVFHPSGVALRSKSVPDGFVTKDFTKKWNTSVYSRLSNCFIDLTGRQPTLRPGICSKSTNRQLVLRVVRHLPVSICLPVYSRAQRAGV
jgi:hypothetical protein